MLLVKLQVKCTGVEIKNRDRLVCAAPTHCQFDSGTRLSSGGNKWRRWKLRIAA